MLTPRSMARRGDGAGGSGPLHLTVREVCALLGVTESTLRNWTDAGLIDAFITPGGHRRYTDQAVQEFLADRRQQLRLKDYQRLLRDTEPHYRSITQADLPSMDWYQRLDAGARLTLREHGRQLLALVGQYISGQGDKEAALESGRRLAGDYGRILAEQGLSLSDVTEAFLVFRAPISQAAAALAHSHRPVTEETLAAVIETNTFIDQFLLAIIRGYEAVHRWTLQAAEPAP